MCARTRTYVRACIRACMLACSTSPRDDGRPLVVGGPTRRRAPPPAPAARQDAPVGAPEVDVTQCVTNWVDSAVDVTQPVTCNNNMRTRLLFAVSGRKKETSARSYRYIEYMFIYIIRHERLPRSS